MKVLITGGCGFLGQMIAKAILARGELRGPDGNVAEVDSIQLFDQLAPVTPFDWADSRVTTAAGDISDKETVSALVDRDDISVFHLASVVSAGGGAVSMRTTRVSAMNGLAKPSSKMPKICECMIESFPFPGFIHIASVDNETSSVHPACDALAALSAAAFSIASAMSRTAMVVRTAVGSWAWEGAPEG